MDKESKSTDKSTDKRLKNLKPAWKKGDPSPNPKGHTLGQRNYATIYKEALIKLAKLNGKTPEELEEEIVSAGLLNARKGNYQFYKDVLDRTHGQAIAKTDITSDGDKIVFMPQELINKHDTSSGTKPDSTKQK